MTIDELTAKIEIAEQLARYCRGVDRLDEEVTLQCFSANARLRYADVFAGSPAEFVRWLWPIHRAMVGHAHRVGNALVELPTETTALSEAYVFVTLRLEREGQLVDVVNHGRYLDRWERSDGVWRIVERTYVSGLRSTVPVTGIDMAARIADAGATLAPIATRDGADPSYALSSFGVDARARSRA